MGLFRDSEPIIQMKHNMAKNPNGWRRTSECLHAWPEIWTRHYQEQIQLAVREGSLRYRRNLTSVKVTSA